MSRKGDETPTGVWLMQGDKNRGNVEPAVGLKLSTGLISHRIWDATSDDLKSARLKCKGNKFQFSQGSRLMAKGCDQNVVGKVKFPR